MSLTRKNKIETYLDKYGWKFKKKASDFFITGWGAEEKDFTMEIKTSENFIYFQTNILTVPSVDFKNIKTVLAESLQINMDSILIKLCWDGQFSFFLKYELMNKNLSYSGFCEIISIICHYSERSYLRLSEVFHTHMERIDNKNGLLTNLYCGEHDI